MHVPAYQDLLLVRHQGGSTTLRYATHMHDAQSTVSISYAHRLTCRVLEKAHQAPHLRCKSGAVETLPLLRRNLCADASKAKLRRACARTEHRRTEDSVHTQQEAHSCLSRVTERGERRLTKPHSSRCCKRMDSPVTLACELPKPLPFGAAPADGEVNGGSPRGGSPRWTLKARGALAASHVAPYQALPVQVGGLRSRGLLCAAACAAAEAAAALAPGVRRGASPGQRADAGGAPRRGRSWRRSACRLASRTT